MKQVIVSALILLFTSCSYSAKKNSQKRFSDFSDSCEKYHKIGSPCANSLHASYLDSMIKEYDIMHPDDKYVNESKATDTICYPIKQK